MPEMAWSALLYTNIIDALPREGVEPLVGILFKTQPSFLSVSLQLGKQPLTPKSKHNYLNQSK